MHRAPRALSSICSKWMFKIKCLRIYLVGGQFSLTGRGQCGAGAAGAQDAAGCVSSGGQSPVSVERERCKSRDGSRRGPQELLPAHVVRVLRPAGPFGAPAGPLTGPLQLHPLGRPAPGRQSRTPPGQAQGEEGRRRRKRRRRGQRRVFPPKPAPGAGGQGRRQEGGLSGKNGKGQQGRQPLALSHFLLEGAGEYTRLSIISFLH